MVSAFESYGAAPVSTEEGTARVTASGAVVRQSSQYSSANVIELKGSQSSRKSSSSRKKTSSAAPAPAESEVFEETPVPQTPEVYDQETGRRLSAFEAYAVSRSPMTDARTGETVYVTQKAPISERRLFGDEVYQNYPYLAAQKEAEVRERVFSPATATVRDIAKREAFTQRTESSLKNALGTAITEQEFSQARSNLRGFEQYQILTGRESYGDITSKNPFKKVAGAFSLGTKSVGQATENLLFEQEEKLRFKDRQAVGTDETGSYALNALKDGGRSAGITALKVGRNIIGGAVTDTGSSPLQGALFAASGGLGVLSGAAKGSGLAARTASVGRNSLFLRSAVRGSGIGLKTVGYGALGVAGYQAARSSDPLGQVSRLGGRLVAFSGAFKAGEAGGYGLGLAAKNTAPAISKAISSVEFPSRPLGKKGAAFRGSRRVSPKSKIQIRQESRGVVQQQKKGARISQDKGADG